MKAARPSRREDSHRRVALVTGANDPEGLGFGIARALVAEGHTVYLGCRTRRQTTALAPDLREFDGQARALEVDVSAPASIARAFARLERESPWLDILVNNAGDGANCPALEETAAQWDRIMAVNARGSFLCAQAAARLMLRRRYGRIVNISSQAATVAIPNHLAYSCSKAAVDMMTRSLALELAGHGITVNAIAPTYLETPGTRASLAQPDFRASVLARLPLGRLGTIQDIAHAVRFLAHEDTSLITGAVLLADGGWTLA